MKLSAMPHEGSYWLYFLKHTCLYAHTHFHGPRTCFCPQALVI